MTTCLMCTAVLLYCCTAAAAAAGADGSIVFWLLGQSEALTKIEIAHENQINGLAFHPMGHEMTTCKPQRRHQAQAQGHHAAATLAVES